MQHIYSLPLFPLLPLLIVDDEFVLIFLNIPSEEACLGNQRKDFA
jgi:hypothetical protein